MKAAVADTHALVWFATGQTSRLGRDALAHFRRVDEQRALVYVPSISLVELLENVRAGSIRLPLPAQAWVGGLLSTGCVAVADLTLDVALATRELFEIPERADGIISATSRVLDLPLITRDPEIGRAASVEVIW